MKKYIEMWGIVIYATLLMVMNGNYIDACCVFASCAPLLVLIGIKSKN